ncbi:hypothetical protein NSTC745_01698 [Nostoc sp. DSM 114161]|jgi:hypothetical protein
MLDSLTQRGLSEVETRQCQVRFNLVLLLIIRPYAKLTSKV